MAVTKRLRFEILRRDNHACRYCGECAPDVKLTIDHVTPVALGGTDDPENLVACCSGCNSGKSSSAPDAALVADVNQDAIRWARAMHRALEDFHGDRQAVREQADEVIASWDSWHYTGEPEHRIPRPMDSIDTVCGYIERGLDVETLISFIPKAMRKEGLRRGQNDRWPYFCGIVNNVLREINERAKTHFDVEEAELEEALEGPPWNSILIFGEGRGPNRVLPAWFADVQEKWAAL